GLSYIVIDIINGILKNKLGLNNVPDVQEPKSNMDFELDSIIADHYKSPQSSDPFSVGGALEKTGSSMDVFFFDLLVGLLQLALDVVIMIISHLLDLSHSDPKFAMSLTRPQAMIP